MATGDTKRPDRLWPASTILITVSLEWRGGFYYACTFFSRSLMFLSIYVAPIFMCPDIATGRTEPASPGPGTIGLSADFDLARSQSLSAAVVAGFALVLPLLEQHLEQANRTRCDREEYHHRLPSSCRRVWPDLCATCGGGHSRTLGSVASDGLKFFSPIMQIFHGGIYFLVE